MRGHRDLSLVREFNQSIPLQPADVDRDKAAAGTFLPLPVSN
jgi:hypothetical protein